MNDSRMTFLTLGAALLYLSAALVDYLAAVVVLLVIIVVFGTGMLFSEADESDPFFNW